MTFTARLDKLTPALSGKERVILAIRAQNAGLEPDHDLLRGMDATQRQEYERYAGLAYVASAELGMLCQVIKNQLEHAASGHHAFEVLQEAAGILAADLEEQVDQRKAKGWRKQKAVSVPEFLAGLATEVREDAVGELTTRWKELRALEIVWAEIRADFDGEDPVVPEVRQRADQAAETARRLAERYGVKRLPEPEQDYVDRTWELVDQVFEAQKLVRR